MSHPAPKEGDAFIPLVRPSFGEEEYAAVKNCLTSGWVTTGPSVAAFEQALKDYFEAPYVLALSSNTAGLYLSLRALSVGPGDEVITTPLTFAATANVIEMTGATTVFCDVDPLTRNICLKELAQKITPKTRAILPVHMYGLPLEMKKLYKIAETFNVRIIEDAAQAMGAKDAGKKIGSLGDTQVFSFHANKNITTCEGGCLVTRDEALFQKVKSLHFHGFDRPAWDRFQKKGKGDYDIVAPGLKFNMTDLQAAIGLCQLKKIKTFQEKRTALAMRYLKAFEDCPYLEVPPQHQGHCWHLFSPLVHFDRIKLSRSELMMQLKEQNIGTGIHYKPLHHFSYYAKKYAYKEGAFPHTEKIGYNTISLPLFPALTFSQQDDVIQQLKTLLEKYRK